MPDEFIQHDVDTTAVGDPIGLVSTVNRVEFPTWKPEHCVEVLKRLGFSAVTGRVATGDWFAVKGDRAAFIRDTFHPLLAEMEGCAMAPGVPAERRRLWGGEVCVRPPVF